MCGCRPPCPAVFPTALDRASRGTGRGRRPTERPFRSPAAIAGRGTAASRPRFPLEAVPVLLAFLREFAWCHYLSYHEKFPSMSVFDAIFFDFDGVLIDSEPVHWACWREVLLPLGVSLEWDFYRDHCIGIDDRDMIRTMAGHRDWKDLWAQYPKKKELFRSRMIAAPPFPEALASTLE